ncbi:hypothetical protein Tco_1043051 [Tanacetum coccineum]|uniref:Uncharacterized protein n=1 Tax=Tanacetum coccineum TaxID=301880 RepID=A0ABQ5GL47_9ASTR
MITTPSSASIASSTSHPECTCGIKYLLPHLRSSICYRIYTKDRAVDEDIPDKEEHVVIVLVMRGLHIVCRFRKVPACNLHPIFTKPYDNDTFLGEYIASLTSHPECTCGIKYLLPHLRSSICYRIYTKDRAVDEDIPDEEEHVVIILVMMGLNIVCRNKGLEGCLYVAFPSLQDRMLTTPSSVSIASSNAHPECTCVDEDIPDEEEHVVIILHLNASFSVPRSGTNGTGEIIGEDFNPESGIRGHKNKVGNVQARTLTALAKQEKEAGIFIFMKLSKNQATIAQVFEETSENRSWSYMICALSAENWKTLLGSWPPQKVVCIWSRRMVRDLILGIDMNQMPRSMPMVHVSSAKLDSCLKALDEGFLYEDNLLGSFSRAYILNVRSNGHGEIEELKDLSSLALDELIGNLKS